VPQYWPPGNEQVTGVQLAAPHRFGTPVPPQVSGAVQLAPQSTARPHPSPTIPQYVPPLTEQLATEGVQSGSAQTPGTNAPQVSFVGQPPQSMVPPQPLPILPQYFVPAGVQLIGVQGAASISSGPSSNGGGASKAEPSSVGTMPPSEPSGPVPTAGRSNWKLQLEPKTIRSGTSVAPAVRREAMIITLSEKVVFHFTGKNQKVIGRLATEL
jgi:hypothetical protein